MPLGFRSAVHGVVLGRGDGFQVAGIIPLHAPHEGHAHAAGEIWVFAVGFLAASPPGVAEDVDVGRPVSEPGGASRQRRQRFGAGRRWPRLRVVVFGARLGGDHVGHALHQRRIPGGGEADGLREHRGTPLHHAVQGFVPPVVGRHAQALDGGRGALHLQHLLFQRHARDQVCGPARRGQLRVEVGLGPALLHGHPGGYQCRQGEHDECRLPQSGRHARCSLQLHAGVWRR